MNGKSFSWLVIIGGATVALSSFLTWMSWIPSTRTVGHSARQLGVAANGGLLVLLMGLLIAGIGFARLARPFLGRWLEGFAIVFMVACFVCTIVDYQSLSFIANFQGVGANWNAGPGYWICLIGPAVALFGVTRWRKLSSSDAISATSISEPWEMSGKGA